MVITSEESKRKMSVAQKKRFSNPEEKKKFLENRITNGMLGKKHSDESKRKMSKSNKGKVPWIKGKKHSSESLLKMGKSHKGQIPWNKGLKGVTISTMKGKTFSEEVRKKMSKARIGKIPWNKGLPLSEKTRRKLSESLKGRSVWNKGKENPSAKNLPQAFKKGQSTWNKGLIGYQAGEKSPLWKGGISFEPYSREWTNALKESIRKRDKYTCQLCGKIQEGKHLSVHHIDYNKKNSNQENLITLCRNCHSKTNVSREKWIKLFLEKQNNKLITLKLK